MATIIMGSYMVRYPMGGNLSWALQYLIGFKDLGHDIYFVEKYAYPDSCYDPVGKKLSSDCSYGVSVVSALMNAYGMGNKWCYVEEGEIYHGLSKHQMDAVFDRADLYIENGSHRSWEEESKKSSALRVYIDVDPAFTQIRMYDDVSKGISLPEYDYYFTNGMNIGREGNVIPTCGKNWHYIFNPVHIPFFDNGPSSSGAAYSTIMNWVSYKERVEYNGISYGHKDLELDKFINLPDLVNAPLEMAVSGLPAGKQKELEEIGWLIKNAQDVTFTFDVFRNYISSCKGEFSVVKHMYQATSSGWFSDKSAAFLAGRRPVVLQETGFSNHLPVGEGLFAVNDAMEAKEAIETIERNYDHHAQKAYEIAQEFLETKRVLSKFLSEIGIN